MPTKAVLNILSANKKDIKKGTKIMMDAEVKMVKGKEKLLKAEKTWVKKAETLETKGRRLKSPELLKAAEEHKKSAIGMTDKVLKSMKR